MKAKSGYSGLGTSTRCISAKCSEWLKIPGKDSKVRTISELFDSGNEEEARKALRKVLEEVTRNIDRVTHGRGSANRNGRRHDEELPSVPAVLPLNMET